MHGMANWFVLAMYAYAVAFLLCLVIDGIKALATRTATHRMRARLARRRADLAIERNRRASEGARAAALAIMAASQETGVLATAGIAGPATRARLLGVDELMMDDSESREWFI